MMRHVLMFAFALFQITVQAQPPDNYAEKLAKYREAYKAGFLTNERSPLKAEDLGFLRFYDADETFNVPCTFTRTPDAKPFDLPTYSGITKLFVKYGILTFKWQGQAKQLSVYKNLTLRNVPQYAGHLFLPFKDLTNGEETYGGGRYMDLTVSEVEAGEVFLDFNKSYNPWCCYSDGYNCPIPPVENSLDIAIRAGEKMFAGEKKQ